MAAATWINKPGLDNAIALFRGLPRLMPKMKREIAQRVATHFLVQLKANLYANSLRLSPLSPTYLAMKKRMGLDPRILLASHQLASKLSVFAAGEDIYVAGVEGGDRVPGSSLTFAQLMAVLEYGSDKISLPGRPLFKLTLMASGVSMRQVAIDEFRRLFREQVKKRRLRTAGRAAAARAFAGFAQAGSRGR